MQKLVSKNPILRFKLGKKIVKAFWGMSTYNSFGLYQPNPSEKLRSKPKTTTVTKQQLDIPVTGRWSRTGNGSIPNIFPKLKNKPVVSRTPVNNRWVNGIQKRDEITDVRATQQMLKDAGFDIGKYGVDGKWGKDTEKAYNLYLTMKNIPVYERTLEQTVDISSPSKVLNSTVVNLEPVTTDLIIANNNTPTVENEGEKYFARNGNYNKSQVRELMRQKGLNPYSFSGSDRKAIRLWLNGETDDWGRLAFKNSRLYDAFVRPYGYKQGGQLVSRNPITRFKNKKK